MAQNIINFEALENKLIKYKDETVLIDSDVAELYGVTTKEINQAVSNNPNKFPVGYIVELTKEEKEEVVKKFDHLQKLKFSPYLPKIFTEKGLYMLATIIKSKIATDTTIKIIETFAKIKKLSRNLNSIDSNQTTKEQKALVAESNILLEEVIDIDPVKEIKEDNVTEIETRIELNLGFAKVSRIVKSKK
ncbi:MAG: ORF6N domain-containing protein [Campylobacterales bacterium]|jgi:hypothetical protein|nr:ORF6N domain-containing protein [Campylobacterales bacterium]